MMRSMELREGEFVVSDERARLDIELIHRFVSESYWARGIPQTYAGDLKMVTEWSRLGFVIRNPDPPSGVNLDSPSPSYKYVCVEDSGVES